MDSERDTSSVENHGRGWRLWQPRLGLAGWTLAGIGILSQAGCMSALTATTLREALRETAASLSSPHDLDHASMARVDPPVADLESPDDEASAGDAAELEQVIDNAVARLAAAGGIDAPTQDLLIKTLEQTRPEDWAVVVNEFAKTLEASRGTIAATDGGTPDRHATGGVIELDIPTRRPAPADVVAPVAEIDAIPPTEPEAAVDLSGIPVLQVAPAVVAPIEVAPLSEPTPPAPQPLPPEPIDVVDLPVRPITPEPAPVPVVVAALIEPAATPSAPAGPVTLSIEPAPMPPTPEAFEVPPTTAPGGAIAPSGPVVSNACFATRVRGWGNVERFPTAAFRPGQELIVYFELDHLQIRSAVDGHTTGMDAGFRLVDAAGQRVGQWSFEPIVETCPAPRRDYFARYFIRIPEDAKPGRHRLEWTVTDTVAAASRQAHLDLEVVAE